MASNKTVGYTPTTGSVARGRRWIFAGGAVVLSIVLLGSAFVLGRTTGSEMPIPVEATSDLPRRDGIPIPTRFSPEGAATAAQNFQIAGFRVSAGRLDSGATASVLLGTDATAAAKRVLAPPTVSNAEQAKTRSSYAPVSAVVQTYELGRATVLVWGVAASSNKLTPQPGGTADWGRSTVSVTWDGAQWRVVDQRFQSGPSPAPSGQRLATTDGDFSFRFDEVEQGWVYVPEP